MRIVESHIFGTVPAEGTSLDRMKTWAMEVEICLADRGVPDEMSLPSFAGREPAKILRSREEIVRALAEADRIISELRLLL